MQGILRAWIPADPREGWIPDPLKWIPAPKMDPLPSQMTVIDRQSKIFKILDLAENCVRGSIFISRIMAQPDFATLAIKDELSDESQNHKEFSIRANRDEGCIPYVPVNFIPEEVCAFIAAWDASTLTTTSSSSDTTLGLASVPFSQHMFEPA